MIIFILFTDIMSISVTYPEGDKPHLALGMVDIQIYAKHYLIQLWINPKVQYRAPLHALPYML